MIEVDEGIFYRENFETSPLKIVIDKLFEIKQKNKHEKNNVMQLLVKLILNSLYGEQIRKDTEESYHRKSEKLMLTEHDERVLDCL